MQSAELHGIRIGTRVRGYSEISTCSGKGEGNVSTKPVDHAMIAMAHQHHWPMTWLEQASTEEPPPLLVCQYCGIVRDDEAREREQTAMWVTMAAYRSKYAAQLRGVPFVPTYCPTCLPRMQGTHPGHKERVTSVPAHTSIKTSLGVWSDRGWLAFLKGLIERTSSR